MGSCKCLAFGSQVARLAQWAWAGAMQPGRYTQGVWCLYTHLPGLLGEPVCAVPPQKVEWYVSRHGWVDSIFGKELTVFLKPWKDREDSPVRKMFAVQVWGPEFHSLEHLWKIWPQPCKPVTSSAIVRRIPRLAGQPVQPSLWSLGSMRDNLKNKWKAIKDDSRQWPLFSMCVCMCTQVCAYTHTFPFLH